MEDGERLTRVHQIGADAAREIRTKVRISQAGLAGPAFRTHRATMREGASEKRVPKPNKFKGAASDAESAAALKDALA